MDLQTFLQNARALQPRYQPSQAVKEHLANINLIAVTGPTSVGKTSLMSKSGIHYVKSDVTRQARHHETNGIEYNFRRDYDQLMLDISSGRFVQYVVSELGFYGTKEESYPAEGLCTLAIYANALNSFKLLGFKSIRAIYILPPNYEKWMERASEHRDTDLKARLKEAKASLETALSDGGYYYIINDDLNQAVNQFKELSSGAAINHSDQQVARDLALKLLTRIETDQNVFV